MRFWGRARPTSCQGVCTRGQATGTCRNARPLITTSEGAEKITISTTGTCSWVVASPSAWNQWKAGSEENHRHITGTSCIGGKQDLPPNRHPLKDYICRAGLRYLPKSGPMCFSKPCASCAFARVNVHIMCIKLHLHNAYFMHTSSLFVLAAGKPYVRFASFTTWLVCLHAVSTMWWKMFCSWCHVVSMGRVGWGTNNVAGE